MIKLGEATTNALNKKFPEKWEAIAKMIRLKYEYDEQKKLLEIYINDLESITIDDKNRIVCNGSVSNETIMATITDLVKNNKTKKVGINV